MKETGLTLTLLPDELTVCQVRDLDRISLPAGLFFLARTDEEVSLVCRTADAPRETLRRRDGWRGFRVSGTLDFSLVGILSRLSGILAAEGISIFAVSTYNTDYVLVRAEDLDRAAAALRAAGYLFR